VHSILPLLYVQFVIFKEISPYRSDAKNTATGYALASNENIY